MKKYLIGFLPVNYRDSGFVLSAVGLVCIFLRLFAYFTDIVEISNRILYLGIGFIAVGLYLIFVVPSEQHENE